MKKDAIKGEARARGDVNGFCLGASRRVKTLNKVFRKIVCLSLCGAMLCAVGCKDKTGQDGPVDNRPEPERPLTEFVLADGGKTDYKAVIPQNAGAYETFAADELTRLFEEATGAELPVVTDGEAEYSESARLISIGETAVKKASGVTAPYKEFLSAGARLVNKGSCVILTGGSGEGTLYAVYDFLNILFGYAYYDIDSYRLEKASRVVLPALDEKNIPDYDRRQYGDAIQEETAGGHIHNAWRLRLKTVGQDVSISGHAATRIVSPAVYNDPSKPETYHPDWFSKAGELDPDKLQLCYTNEEMTAQFIENAKAIMREYPDTTRIGFTQADFNTWCDCDDCKAAMRKYNNGAASFSEWGAITQTLFLNKVVPALDEWLAAEYPGRPMTYLVLAYHQTINAPAHRDAAGKWVPNGSEDGDYSMVLPDNVEVSYASIYADRNKNFKENPSERSNLEGWGAVAPNTAIYEYPQDASNVCLPYDGLHVFADNLRFGKELGFRAYNMQGNYGTQSSGFTPLKMYVASRLMWDVSLDPNELARDYIEVCFQEAAPVMQEYYEALRTRLAELRALNGYGNMVLRDGLSEQNWPRSLMLVYQDMFDRAYAAVDDVQFVDKARYDALFRKIKIEEMFVKYVNCSLYRMKYSAEDRKKEIDDFEYYAKLYNFRRYNESKPMSDVINQWRNT